MTSQTDVMVVLKSLEKQAKPQMNKVSALEVKSTEDFELAGKLLKNIKEIAKEAKEKEDNLTVPLNKLLKDVRSLFKPFRDSVALLEEDTKFKMGLFLEQQKQKAKQLEKDFEDGKIKRVSTVVEKVNALQVTSRYSQTRKVWTALPIDESKTPREFMMPDIAKIKEALKSGQKVAGWKWEQVDSIAI